MNKLSFLIFPLLVVVFLCSFVLLNLRNETREELIDDLSVERMFVKVRADSLTANLRTISSIHIDDGILSYTIEYPSNKSILFNETTDGVRTDLDFLKKNASKLIEYKDEDNLTSIKLNKEYGMVKCPTTILAILLNKKYGK